MIDIQGKRVVLRTMSREEYHQTRRAYVPDPIMDPDPYRYDATKTDEEYDSMRMRAVWYPTVGIFLREGGIIGLLSFKRIDRERSRCELGIALNTDACKEKGYGTEAFSLAVDHAFSALGLERVYADTMGSNVRMQRILNRLGFRCYHRMQAVYDMKDRWEDRLDYVLTREDWAARPAAPAEG